MRSKEVHNTVDVAVSFFPFRQRSLCHTFYSITSKLNSSDLKNFKFHIAEINWGIEGKPQLVTIGLTDQTWRLLRTHLV